MTIFAYTQIRDIGFMEEYVIWYGSWGTHLGVIESSHERGFFCSEYKV